MAKQNSAAERLQEVQDSIAYSSTAELVDMYGDLKEQLSALEAQAKEIKDKLSPLEEDLKEITDQYGDEDTFTLEGEAYEIKFGVKATRVTEIDKKAVFEIIGPQAWYELTMPSITDLRKYLNPPQVAKHISEERSGARRKTIKTL